MSTSLDSRSLTAPLRLTRPAAAALAFVALLCALAGILMTIGGLVATIRSVSGSGADLHKAVLALLLCAPMTAVALTACWRLSWQAVTGRETQLMSWWLALPTFTGVLVPTGIITLLMQFVQIAPQARVGLFFGLCLATAGVTLLFVRRARARLSAQRAPGERVEGSS